MSTSALGIIDAIQQLGKMEEEMELIKQAISIQQKLNKIALKKQELAKLKQKQKKNKKRAEATQKKHKVPLKTDYQSFAFSNRYSTLYPVGFSVSPSQEYLAKCFYASEVAEAHFLMRYYLLAGTLNIEQQCASINAHAKEPDLELDMHSPSPTYETMFLPYLSQSMIKTLDSLDRLQLESVVGDLGLGQPLHIPFSTLEETVVLNYLDNIGQISANICNCLPGRSLFAVQLYLQDILHAGSQYPFVIEWNGKPPQPKNTNPDIWLDSKFFAYSAQVPQQTFMRFSPSCDSNLVLAGKTGIICDLQAGSVISMPPIKEMISTVEVTKNYILAGCDNGVLNAYNATDGTHYYTCNSGPHKFIDIIAAHPTNSNYIISATRDKRMSIWDLNTKAHIVTIVSANNVAKMSFGNYLSADLLFVMNDGGGNVMGMYDLRRIDYTHHSNNAIEFRTFAKDNGGSTCFEVSHSGAQVIVGGNRLISLYDIRLDLTSPIKHINLKDPIFKQATSEAIVTGTRFSACDTYACVTYGGTHYVYDMRKTKDPVRKTLPTSSNSSLRSYACWTHTMGSLLLATSLGNNLVQLWDGRSSEVSLMRQFDTQGEVTDLKFSNDDMALACSSVTKDSRFIHLYSVDSKHLSLSFNRS